MFVPAPRRTPTFCSLKCSVCGYAAASRLLAHPQRHRKHRESAGIGVDRRSWACQMNRHWRPLCWWFVALCLPQQFYYFLPGTEYIFQPPNQIHGLLELRGDVMTVNFQKKKNTCSLRNCLHLTECDWWSECEHLWCTEYTICIGIVVYF